MADEFVDLEDTEQLVLETAHGELVRLSRKAEAVLVDENTGKREAQGLSYLDTAKLKVLHNIVRDAKELVLKQFIIRKRFGADDVPPAAVEASKQIGPAPGEKKH